MEKAGRHRDRVIKKLEDVALTHSAHLITMNRQIEDLDNRGHRNNIRMRGVPESVGRDEIKPALQSVFNSLLERPEELPIEFERAQRALRP